MQTSTAVSSAQQDCSAVHLNARLELIKQEFKNIEAKLSGFFIKPKADDDTHHIIQIAFTDRFLYKPTSESNQLSIIKAMNAVVCRLKLHGFCDCSDSMPVIVGRDVDLSAQHQEAIAGLNESQGTPTDICLAELDRQAYMLSHIDLFDTHCEISVSDQASNEYIEAVRNLLYVLGLRKLSEAC